ncbi:MAG TPA: hypothetical protein DIW44_11795 [Anaerolineaceae bacterium]|nr:hypothetical protein [Anaerolineaceae bacterium]
MRERKNELAPCGVFCGACPSYNKTCVGCSTENKDQKRTSKWSCKVRNCCYLEQKKNYCIECDKFPCRILKKKIIDTHPEEENFKYRHEIPEVFEKAIKMNIEDFLEYQKKRWSCPSCGGIINFYKYTCSECGKKVIV